MANDGRDTFEQREAEMWRLHDKARATLEGVGPDLGATVAAQLLITLHSDCPAKAGGLDLRISEAMVRRNERRRAGK